MLYFVGVGSGDPELITLKAVRILREVDAIVLPDSGKESAIWKIIEKWVENKPVYSVSMPMSGRKENWQSAHRQAVEQIEILLQKHASLAYPMLGDTGIYASGSYLMQQIAPYYPCQVIAGIPSVCASAAALGIPLCQQGESLVISDHVPCENGDNVVIMKAGKQLEELAKQYHDRDIYLACDLGMEHEWFGKLQDLPRDAKSYFMTAIIKKRHEP